KRSERGGQLGVGRLGRKLLGPIQSQVEVAATVVDFVHLAAGRLVLVQERARRQVERVGQDLRPLVVGDIRQLFEAGSKSEELAEAVPPQVVLTDELLHVLWRRTAGAGFE